MEWKEKRAGLLAVEDGHGVERGTGGGFNADGGVCPASWEACGDGQLTPTNNPVLKNMANF